MDIFEKERQARISEFRQKTSEKFLQLLRSPRSIESIVQMLGAEEFLTTQIQRGKREPVHHFDFRGFLDDQITKGLFLRLPDDFVIENDVLLPPDPKEVISGESREGKEIPEIIARSKELVSILTEMNQSYFVIEGTNTATMMRGRSYRAFVIPGLEKMVLVNDEEGNATYIVHDIDTTEDKWKLYLQKTKNELREEDNVSLLVYPGNLQDWKQLIVGQLSTVKFIKSISRVGPETPSSDSYENEDPRKEITERYDEYKDERPPTGWMQLGEIIEASQRSSTMVIPLVKAYRASNPEWIRQYRNKRNRLIDFFHPDLIAKVLEILREKTSIALRPEGWKTINILADELEMTHSLIQNFATQFRTKHPEWFSQYRGITGHIREFLSPELVEKIVGHFSVWEYAPEGWYPNTRLAHELGATKSLIKSIADEARESHGEWFQKFKSTTSSGEREYYHPDLCAWIRLKYQERQEKKAPRGWITCGAIREKINVSFDVIEKETEKYRNDHPEWFQYYFDSTNRWHEHYAPELVELVEKFFIEKKQEAPLGWMYQKDIARKLETSGKTVSKFVELYRNEFPAEYFQMYPDSSMNIREYYHPDIIARLEREYHEQKGKFLSAPDGWKTNMSLKNELKVDYETVTNIADTQRAEHPEWFQEYLDRSQKVAEHFAPELVTLISKELENRVPAPLGWRTVGNIQKVQKVDYETVKKISEVHRASHPEWFKMYKGISGLVSEHLAPELISIVVTEIESRVFAPEGWKSSRNLRGEFNVGDDTIKRIADAERVEHPEWFKMYKATSGRLTEHYAPELVVLLAQRLKKVD